MSYKNTGPQYKKFAPFWQKMRDCIDGQQAIYARNEKYLPRLDQQTDDQYQAYRDRALFLNATGKTVDSLVGLVFRKPPSVELPPAAAEWENNISGSGTSIEEACRLTMSELLTTGVFGWLVDFPSGSTEGQTVAQAKETGHRPYAKFYPAESIINKRTDTFNGEERLSLLVLKETVLSGTDEFDTTTTTDQYRVFDLVDGKCRYRLFREGEDQTNGDDFITVNGSMIDYIPFVMMNANGERNNMIIPPLNGLADINISHYKLYADYRHGLHFTALPTPTIIGVDKDFQCTIGPQSALLLPEGGDAKYLEFGGQGLDGIAAELKALQDRMSIFGARLLRESTKGVEAAETAQINRSSETSNVASWAGIVGSTLTSVINIMLEWATISGEVSVQLNKDYTPTTLTAQELTALVSAYQSGAITMADLLGNFQRGEIVREDKTVDEHIAELSLDGPTMLDMSE